MLRMLARSAWIEYPESRYIRVIFGSVSLPSLDFLRLGIEPTHEVLFANDYYFSARSNSERPSGLGGVFSCLARGEISLYRDLRQVVDRSPMRDSAAGNSLFAIAPI